MLTKTALFNPLSSEFSYEWLDDNNTPHLLVMPPISISYFTKEQAPFMLKHLTDEVMHQRGINPINNAQEVLDLKNELLVNL